MIGDPQVRNRGTIGGNIAHADPASDMPTVLVAADAWIHLHGGRMIRAQDFFVDLFETDMEEDDIITKNHRAGTESRDGLSLRQAVQSSVSLRNGWCGCTGYRHR